jgi:Mn-containing catalase
MFVHNKRLHYTVHVPAPNPGLANLLLEQFGGPQGELAAACRYFTQAVAEEDSGRRDMLFDIEDPQPAVDGGDGLANVQISEDQGDVLRAMVSRTASAVETDPVTGADLGARKEGVFKNKTGSKIARRRVPVRRYRRPKGT